MSLEGWVVGTLLVLFVVYAVVVILYLARRR
jgi:hypothetical protein